MGNDKVSSLHGQWTSKLYLIWDVHRAHKHELVQTTPRFDQFHQHHVTPAQEQIIWIEKFSAGSHDMMTALQHQYLVLQTTNHWWSLQKNSKGLFLQKADNQEQAIRWRWGTLRTNPLLLTNDQGRQTLADLLTHIQRRSMVWEGFHCLNNNCKHFAQKIFEEFRL